MKDDNKTKKQLVHELAELRSQNAGLEKIRKELAVIKIAADEVSEYAESVINTVREPLIALDQDLRVVTVNRSFYEFFKVNPEDTMGQLIYDLGNRQWDIPKLRELLETILPEKATFDNYEVEHDFATIGNRTMLLNARQIERASGKERIILLAIEDITERKQLEDLIEEALLKSEKSYRTLFSRAVDGIFIMNVTGELIDINESFARMHGYSTQEMLHMNLKDLDTSKSSKPIPERMRSILAGESMVFEVEHYHKDGRVFPLEVSASLISSGGESFIQCFHRDATDRKKAEEALLNSKARYHALFEQSPYGILLIDPETGKIIEANETAYKQLGYTREEFAALRIPDYEAVEKPEETAKHIQKIIRDGSDDFETLHRTKSGEIRNVHIWAKIVQLSDQSLFYAIYQDITDRKQAEEALGASEANFRQSLEDSPLGVRVVSTEGETLYVNRATLDIFGCDSIEEWQTTPIVKRYTEQSYAEFKIRREKKRLAADDSTEYEIDIVRKDGEVRHLYVWRTKILWDGREHYQVRYNDITDSNRSEKQLQETLESLRKAFGTTIQVMISAIETRDPYTAGHQKRVTTLARAIATEMELSQDTIEALRMAGPIHDIGKLSMPAEILSKPGKLSEIEFSLIKEHVRKGYEMLKDVESPWPLAEIVYQHHERMDGSGYPRNLKGDDIIMEARILAVADTVEGPPTGPIVLAWELI